MKGLNYKTMWNILIVFTLINKHVSVFSHTKNWDEPYDIICKGVQSKRCSVKSTDCETIRKSEDDGNGLMLSSNELTLTPWFSDFFNTSAKARDTCLVEERWRPQLNISWTQDVSAEDREYLVKVEYVDKYDSRAHAVCRQCIQVNVTGDKSISGGKIQGINLVSKNIKYCGENHPAHVVSVRLAIVNGASVKCIGMASISFTIEKDRRGLRGHGIQGLPMHYSRIVPPVNAQVLNERLNPRHWVTPISIINSSCSQELSVAFELIPFNEMFTKYDVQLSNYESTWENNTIYNQVKGQTFGTKVFKNIPVGTYYVYVKIHNTEDSCPTLVAPGKRELSHSDPCNTDSASACPYSRSGYFRINDCPQPPSPTTIVDNPSISTGILVTIVISCLALIVVMLVLLVRNCNSCIDTPTSLGNRRKLREGPVTGMICSIEQFEYYVSVADCKHFIIEANWQCLPKINVLKNGNDNHE